MKADQFGDELKKAFSEQDHEEFDAVLSAYIEESICYSVFDGADPDYIMHADGSVSEVTVTDDGGIIHMTLRPEKIMKILNHYRPFEAVFNGE